MYKTSVKFSLLHVAIKRKEKQLHVINQYERTQGVVKSFIMHQLMDWACIPSCYLFVCFYRILPFPYIIFSCFEEFCFIFNNFVSYLAGKGCIELSWGTCGVSCVIIFCIFIIILIGKLFCIGLPWWALISCLS